MTFDNGLKFILHQNSHDAGKEQLSLPKYFVNSVFPPGDLTNQAKVVDNEVECTPLTPLFVALAQICGTNLNLLH